MDNFASSPLLPLCKLQHPVADLVKSYMEKKSEWTIDEYFNSRTKAYFADEELVMPASFAIEPIYSGNNRHFAKDVRLLSVQANYFRGFRKQSIAMDVSQELVVIDGLNSSGKTSVAEAIEWILTGEISRRQMGDPKELSDCIANKFRPENEETWVQCIVQFDGKSHTLKRLLTHDYEEKQASRCKSRLFIDDNEVQGPAKPLDTMFAGASPLLMQQTLQEFIYSKPSRRRTYFEQLFNLDDITTLISKAVVGDIGLGHFGRPIGGDMLAKWIKLTTNCKNTDSAVIAGVEQSEQYLDSVTLKAALREIAIAEFGLDKGQNLGSMAETIEDLQRRARNSQFPFLDKIAPLRTLDQAAVSQLTRDTYNARLQGFDRAEQMYRKAFQSNDALTDAQEVVARTLHILQEANLIEDDEYQTCPLCEFAERSTLSRKRLDQIALWDETRRILSNTRTALNSQLEALRQDITNLVSLRIGLIPGLPSDSERENVEPVEFADTFAEFKAEHFNVSNDGKRFDALCTELLQYSTVEDLPLDFGLKLEDLFSQLHLVKKHARVYRDKYDDLETRVGALAATNPVYAARSYWLDLSRNSDDLLAHFRWETAKARAKQELDLIRDGLKDYRRKTLESCRRDVSDGMTEIWSILREDVYSGFKKILIPTPTGKGFPVKMEVKAVLDDGSVTHELDALKVMSESQLNAIGVAAFITRSQLLGQRCIVFDDPVQSMDDDHIRSFADNLLLHLSESNYQVIVLTHNDRFSREISHSHFHRCEYVSKRLQFSQDEGILITEGNRRVIERLNSAEKLAKRGDLDRAWYFVRLALERLYLVAKIKHGPQDFKPAKWEEHTAEAMWNEGVDEIFGRLAPGQESRLKGILRMTVPGAHDETSKSQTEVIRAIKHVRPLLNQLRLGDA